MQKVSEARGGRSAPGVRAWSTALLVAFFTLAWCASPAPVAAVDRTDCFDCHDGSDGPTVDEKLYDQTVHADMDCTECHDDVKDVPHDAPLAKVDCSQCHDGVQAVYNGSIHGTAQKSGIKEAASCPDCHGMHNIFAAKDSRSMVYPLNLVETCGTCHSNAALAAKYDIPVADAYQKYKVSVHGRALLRSGLVVSAVCNDCHGTHDILPHADPKSKINYKNIRTTCGACHTGVLDAVRPERARPGARIRRDAPERQGGADLHRLPPLALDRPHHRGRLEAAQPRGVRQLPRRPHRHLPRDLPRAGHEPRLRQGRPLQRLPRLAQHPAGVRPEVDARGRREQGPDLPQVPPECEREFHQVHAPRRPQGPRELPDPLLHLLRDDRPAHRHLRLLRPAHAALADPLAQGEAQGAAAADHRGEDVLALRPLRAHAALHDHRQLPDARDDRHPAEVQLHAVGQDARLVPRRLRGGRLRAPRRWAS